MEVNLNINVNLTEGAAKELSRVREEQNISAENHLRVGVQGGGCSGFQYALNFEEANEYNEETDIKFEQHGVQVVVDKKSLLFLDGTTIGWHEDLNKRGFTFDNPQATKSCGCGSSFSV
jgi:iron-sulfur cluster assembly protein